MTVLGKAKQKGLKLNFPLVKMVSWKKIAVLEDEGMTEISATCKDLRMQGLSSSLRLCLNSSLASAKAKWFMAARWLLET